MNWRTIPLDDAKASVPYAFVGGPFGSNLTTRDYVEEGVPVIRGNNLPIDASFRDDDFVFVTEKKADDLRSNTAYPGDLVFTQRGTLGQVGLVPRESRFQRYIISQSQMKLTVDPEVADARFVYYFFRLPATVQKVINHALTSGVPHINLGILKEFTITLPEIRCQKHIADFLSSYDDLIENNRRRMALLEEAARQLYREWFVRLRFPGHEHTRITNGVPEGWQFEKVGSLLAKIESKKRIPKEDYLLEGPIPCVDQSADFIGGFTDDEEAVYMAPLPVIVFGDHTRVLKFVNFEFARGADGTQLIYPKTERISTEYLYLALREVDLSNYFYARHFKFLKEKEVLLPEPSLVREFNLFAKPVFEQIRTIRSQNHKLRAARDLLLPRLMSGEIVI